LPNIDNIIRQLKNRKVFRSVAIYAGFAFVLLQVCDIVIPRLFLPDWTMTLIIVLVIIGFPIIVVFAWIYDIAPSEDGETPTKEATQPLGIYALTGLVLTVIGIGFWVTVGVFGISFAGNEKVPSIGILMMENLGNEENDFWTRGVTEDLIIKIAGAGLIRVAPMKEILEIDTQKSFEEIAKKLKVEYLLTSSMHKKEDGFDLRCQLIEAESGKSVYANKWSKPLEDVATIVGQLGNNILSSLNVSIQEDFTMPLTTNHEAYEFYLRGKFQFQKRETKEDIAIARDLLNKSLQMDNNLIQAKIKLGETFLATDQYDNAMEIFEQCLEQSTTFGNKKMIAHSLDKIGVIYDHKGNYEKAMYYHIQSLKILEEQNDMTRAGSLNWIGRIYGWTGDYDVALDYFEKALELSHKLQDEADIAYCFYLIGSNYSEKGDYHKAIEYYNKSVSIASDIEMLRQIIKSYKGIGIAHEGEGNYDEALNYYSKSFILDEKSGNKWSIAETNHFIGRTFFYKNNFFDAKKSFHASYKIWVELKQDKKTLRTLSWLALTILELGDSSEETETINTLNSILKNTSPYKEDVIIVNWNLYQVYSKTEKTELADNHLQVAYEEVMNRANKFNEQKDRKAYLNNIKINRDVIETFQRVEE
jgi:tetratricopeptide (TPR) repeat protein/TolB-like protein